MELLPGDRAVRAEVDSEWGEVDERSAEIRTEIRFPSPNAMFPSPEVVNGNVGSFGVEYVAEMNGVRVAEAEKSGVRLDPHRTVVRLDARMENGSIRDWWKSHIESGEESQMRVKPRLRLNLAMSDIGVRVPSYRADIDTDVLGFLNEADRREKTVLGRTVFAVDEVDADWGEPDGDETPVKVTAAVENPTPFPVGFSDIVCDVRMNGVGVGDGGTVEGFSLGPGETDEVDLRVTLDNDRLPEWWATHVDNGEQTEITVDVYGAVDVFGKQFRVHLLTYSGEVETSVLTD